MSDVFNDIQSVRNFLNRNVQLPKTLPNGCNAVCYYGVGYYLSYCKEVNNHVYHYAENVDRWLTTGFENLEKMARYNNKFAYLRLSEKLGNSVTTLQEWGNMVIENSKQIASKGDKSE